MTHPKPGTKAVGEEVMGEDSMEYSSRMQAISDFGQLQEALERAEAAEVKLSEAVDALVDAKAFMSGEISGEYQRKAILREIETALAKLEPET
jgi:hypothetical protein